MNYQTLSKAYKEKIFKYSKNQDLANLAFQVLKNAEKLPKIIPKEKIQISLATEADLLEIEKIIKIAYNWRYCPEQGAKLSNFSEVTTKPNSWTIAVKYVDKNFQLVIATARLVREDIELFSFFTPIKGQEWKCHQQNLIPYEFERFSFHPVFEINKDRQLQMQITRDIVNYAKSFIKEDNYWLVGTMKENIRLFVEQTGLKFTKIPNLVFNKNEYTDFLVDLFPSYFKDFYAYEFH